MICLVLAYLLMGCYLTLTIYSVEDSINGGPGNGFKFFWDELGWNMPGGKARRTAYAEEHRCAIELLPPASHFWFMMSVPAFWIPYIVGELTGCAKHSIYSRAKIWRN